MPQFLVVMEARAKAPVYETLLDVLERRMGARRILRTAWVIDAPDAETVYGALLFYRPHVDGLLILPYGEPRLERNLRGMAPLSRLAADEEIAALAVDQTPE